MSFEAQGGQFRVSQPGPMEQGSAEQDVAWLSSGRFAVVYREIDSQEAYAQVFAADGSPFGARILIEPHIRSILAPAITATADGGFALSWTEQIDSDFAEGQIYGATYDANYDVGYTFIGNLNTIEGSQVDSDIAALPGGGLVTVWTANEGDVEVKGRVINPPTDEFTVNPPNEDNQFLPSIATLAGGNLVVAYVTPDASDYGVEARILSPGGVALGDAFQVDTNGLHYQVMPQVAGLQDGGFVVVWQDESGAYYEPSGLGDTDSYAIKAQLFDADGTRRGTEFLVNTTTAGGQTRPAVAALADGGFVVAWQGAPGEDSDVYAQAFVADGARDGVELLVNTVTAGEQYDVQVAAGAEGGFVVTWTSTAVTGGPYPTGQSVEARLFGVAADSGGIEGSGASETLRGTVAGERIAGLSGDDVLFGLAGDDRLYGGDGNDVLKGGAGNDRLDGGAGIDTADYAEASGGVTVALAAAAQDTGGAGMDTLIAIENLNGSRLADLLSGDGGANRIKGATGNDVLFGNGGDDFLFGDGGDDVLDGGAGYDVLAGGAGNDRFVFTSLDGDLIKDWQAGETIDVSALHPAAVQLTVHGGKTTARFDLDGDGAFDDGSILIQAVGVHLSDFVI